jgi:hypothetical protein
LYFSASQIVERTEVDQYKKAQKLADELKKQRTAELERKRELALKKERYTANFYVFFRSHFK